MKQVSIRFYTLVSIGVVALLVFMTTLGFAGGLVLAPMFADSALASETIPSNNRSLPAANISDSDSQILEAYENALGSIYEASVPSVVRINITQGADGGSSNESPFQPGPDGFQFPRQGQGSGFVWDTDGHIVTNFHVVDGAEKVEVLFENGTNVEAEVIGTDPDSDLAVIKVDLPADELIPIPIGDSNALSVGQLTVAIGAPFGQDFTMTTGIVSAIGRTIRSGNTPFSIPAAIQTDASINPGNSGGPLLNRQGEVVGINTQILSRSGSNSGVGFAVPIDIAKRVVPSLITDQDYDYAWLGISGNTLAEEVAELMNLPADTSGALIIGLAQDGPAEDAGLLGSEELEMVEGIRYSYGGDIITAIDGNPIEGINDLIRYLVDETRPGDEIIVDVIRDGETIEIEVTLGSRPTN
ncbi:MAG: trypsin-like peptidase domain-containing protein [Chloroflexota bacterium]